MATAKHVHEWQVIDSNSMKECLIVQCSCGLMGVVKPCLSFERTRAMPYLLRDQTRVEAVRSCQFSLNL